MILKWNAPYRIVIEIENKQCKVLNTLKTQGILQFKISDIRSIEESSVKHLVELPLEYKEKLHEINRVKVRKNEGKRSIWIESKGCDICNTILSHGSFLISGRSTKYHIIYSFISPNFNAFKDILFELESNNLKPKVLEIEKYESKEKILTEKQERVLWLALKVGFFDYPRRINTVELSCKLGIAPSTLSEIIRRGTRRLLKNHLKTF